MLFAILLTAQFIICISMGGLILIQRSEGGALGMGGGPSGFMSARGAGNLLTRMTGILAVAFFACTVGLTIAGNMENKVGSATEKVDTSGLGVDVSKLGQGTPPAQAPADNAATSSPSAPSLADLPLAGVPSSSSSAAPASAAPASATSRSASSTSAALPAPLKVPASSSSSSSVSQQKINQAKAGIWQSSSSSASGGQTPKAPASSSSSTPQ